MSTSFAALELDSRLLSALDAAKHHNPTPIQAAAIPVALAGRDVMGCAQTGTGKTSSFVLPILHRLAKAAHRTPRRLPRALILAPTRELAMQILDTVRQFSQRLPIDATLLIGGAGMHAQAQSLARGTDIIVATPGRLIDHLERGGVSLEDVEMVVLDEADRMLDMGFIRPVKRILADTSERRQTLLFTATLSKEIETLARGWLRSPERIEVAGRSSTPSRVHQMLFWINATQKRDALFALLEDPSVVQAIIFVRTKHGADRLARQLDQGGFRAVALHGNKTQGQRRQALERFKRGSCGLLVATDIAARGIDVHGVSHVINFDPPQSPEDYVHRIGRTGRAEASGTALSLVDPSERHLVRNIERLIRRPIDPGTIDGFEPAKVSSGRSSDPRPPGCPPRRGRRMPRHRAA